MTPCEQKDNIQHIQDELANHKVWRRETTEVLSDIKILCATMEERLKTRCDSWDKHVEEGKGWRRLTIGIAVGLIVQFGGLVFASGILFEKIHRLEVLHPYGVAIEDKQ